MSCLQEPKLSVACKSSLKVFLGKEGKVFHCAFCDFCGCVIGLDKPVPLFLCGRPLTWWAFTASRLGHELHQSGKMRHDDIVQLVILISMSVEIRESFLFASPPSMLRVLQVYCSSFYGSLAGWDLDGPQAKMFYEVWRLNILLSQILPMATHRRYFLPFLAPGSLSARGEIA